MEWRSARKLALENHIGSIQVPRKTNREGISLKQVVIHFIGTDNSKYHKAASINAERTFDMLKAESEEEVNSQNTLMTKNMYEMR